MVGVRYVGWFVAVLIIAFGIPPAIFCHENARALKQMRIGFSQATRLTLANRPFVWITGVLLFVLVGFNLIAPLGLYINIYYVFEGDKERASELQGWGLSLWAVLGMASLPLITHAAKRWGKKRTLFAGQALMIATSLRSWLTYSPESRYLQLISVGLAGPALFCVLIMTASILTDVCDLDELKSGLRREGMYLAMNALIVKAGFGVAIMLSGHLLDFAGYTADVAPSESTITSLRLLYAVLPAAFCALTLAMNWYYPLRERELKQIRRILDVRIRRAALAESDAVADAL